MCSHPPTQYAAYSMLSTALPGIMEQWEKNKTVIKEEEDISQRPLPYAITRCIMEVRKYASCEECILGNNIVQSCLSIPSFILWVTCSYRHMNIHQLVYIYDGNCVYAFHHCIFRL